MLAVHNTQVSLAAVFNPSRASPSTAPLLTCQSKMKNEN
jgi:hypothetical protein